MFSKHTPSCSSLPLFSLKRLVHLETDKDKNTDKDKKDDKKEEVEISCMAAAHNTTNQNPSHSLAWATTVDDVFLRTVHGKDGIPCIRHIHSLRRQSGEWVQGLVFSDYFLIGIYPDGVLLVIPLSHETKNSSLRSIPTSCDTPESGRTPGISFSTISLGSGKSLFEYTSSAFSTAMNASAMFLTPKRGPVDECHAREGVYLYQLKQRVQFEASRSTITHGLSSASLGTVNHSIRVNNNNFIKCDVAIPTLLWDAWGGNKDEESLSIQKRKIANQWAIFGGSFAQGTCGALVFFNIRLKEEAPVVKFGKYPITSLQLVEDSVHTFRYIIIGTGTRGGYWKLILEQWNDNQEYESLLHHPPEFSSHFIPQPLTRFPPESSIISVSNTNNGTRIAVLDILTYRCLIFDSCLSKFPLFVYQHPLRTSFLYVSPKLAFCLEDSPLATTSSSQETSSFNSTLGSFVNLEIHAAKLRIVSNLLAYSSNTKWLLKNKGHSVLQEFLLGINEILLGIATPDHKTQFEAENDDELSSISLFIYTSKSIYSLQLDQDPRTIFFSLVEEGREKPDAENLGKTLGLDLFQLYEEAADNQFDKGFHGRALELYSLSNVAPTKLIQRFLQIDRMDVVISHLKNLLRTPESLAVSERKILSDILLKCYLKTHLAGHSLTMNNEQKQEKSTPRPHLTPHKHVYPTDPLTPIKLFQPPPHIERATISTDFDEFVRTNHSFDVGTALVTCLKYGLVMHFLLISCQRNIVPKALRMLVFRGVSLTEDHLQFLIQQGASEELTLQPRLLAAIPVEIRAHLIISKPSAFHKFGMLLWKCLPQLKVESLFKIAAFLDPYGPSIAHIINTSSNNKMESIQPQFPPDDVLAASNSYDLEDSSSIFYPVEYTELFLATLLHICIKIKAQPPPPEDKEQDALQNPEELNQTIIRSVLETRKASQISCGWDHTLVLTDSGEIYSWGINTHGQLGHGNKKTSLSPQRINALHGLGFRYVSAGGHHSLAVSTQGSLWSWGGNSHGQLGLNHTETQLIPQPVKTFTENNASIVQIACGYEHSLILDENNVYYSCGSGSCGQLGQNTRSDMLVPHAVTGIRGSRLKPIQITCGHSHSCLVTESGDVFSWGSNRYGQLGHGDFIDYLGPKAVSSLHGRRIRSASCGSEHTLVITDLGNIYSWGRATQRQLGYGTGDDSPSPHLIHALLNRGIVSVAGGANHTAAVSESGDIFTFGHGVHGELGQGTGIKECIMPALVSLSNKQLGDDNDKNDVTAEKTHKFITVQCGEHSSFAITEDGPIFSWGIGLQGQLGNGYAVNKARPVELEPIHEKVNYRLLETWKNNNAFRRSGDKLLHNSLISQYGKYRPSIILNLSHDLSNWEACSTIYKKMDELFSALKCDLLALDRKMKAKSWKKSAISKYLLNTVFSEYLHRIKQCPALLKGILDFWFANKINPKALFEFLLSNKYQVSAAYSNLIMNNEIAKLPIPPSLSLLLLHHHLLQLQEQNTNNYNNVSESRLWICIFDNLRKDLAKRDKLVITPKIKLTPGEARVVDLVAFSCGHDFPHNEFTHTILPKFHHLVETNFPSLSISLKMILLQYKQDSIHLACPFCLYNNFFRLEKNNIRPWNIDE